MSAALSGTIALLCMPAMAETQYWDYRDWTVTAETVDTGEDIRVTCKAHTGGDGDPVVSVTLSNGDAGPPYAYPSVAIEEHAPRHHTTLMQDGDTINFLFDDGDSAATSAVAGFDEDGFAEAEAGFYDMPGNLQMLQGMRRAGQIEVIRGRDIVYTASLNGFTAAYGKMAEACGFSTIGVIE
ncbi:hypothetical protein [Breoghania sp. L-A4]|uniref:hypothetical protein n=1 Tax=Breoghania sp. L-A4 TaxID=2304600 RepID=UPI000E35CD5B|nr:hypothetical protein [Breoghania sp. L-A4]AXS40809.1 hypothetical protein D1F64_13045 [Breoghania sp. L-A4]